MTAIATGVNLVADLLDFENLLVIELIPPLSKRSYLHLNLGEWRGWRLWCDKALQLPSSPS
eukprot:scaffold33326_cov72-Cyclotella_meneghiniana.AAC.1